MPRKDGATAQCPKARRCVGPKRAADFRLRASVEVTKARKSFGEFGTYRAEGKDGPASGMLGRWLWKGAMAMPFGVDTSLSLILLISRGEGTWFRGERC